MRSTGPLHRGFTLIEMVVVISMIGLLLTLAVPRYFASIDRGRRTVQQQNLVTMRDAIDKFYADSGRYPESLEELVDHRYLRSLPIDPMTEKSDWIIVPPPQNRLAGVSDAAIATQAPDGVIRGNVYDVKSNAVPAAPTS